ncbi:MAG: hypothetical protein RIE73_36785 [Coleofasciculus sp. C1-SOL-03]
MRRLTQNSTLPIAHCPLPIAHCPLPIAHCPLPIAYSLFPIPYSLFPVPCSLISTVNFNENPPTDQVTVDKPKRNGQFRLNRG